MTLQEFRQIFNDYYHKYISAKNFYDLVSDIEIIENHKETEQKFKNDRMKYKYFYSRFFNIYNEKRHMLFDELFVKELVYFWGFGYYLPFNVKYIMLYILNKRCNLESQEDFNKRMATEKPMINKEDNILRYKELLIDLECQWDDFFNPNIENFNKFIDFVSSAIRNEILTDVLIPGIYNDFKYKYDELEILPSLYDFPPELYRKDKQKLDLKEISLYSYPYDKNKLYNAIKDIADNSFEQQEKNRILLWGGLNFACSLGDANHHNAVASAIKSNNVYCTDIIDIKNNFDKLTLKETYLSIINTNGFTLFYNNNDIAQIPDARFAMLFELEKARYLKNKNHK